MKVPMKWQEKSDILLQVTADTGLTVFIYFFKSLKRIFFLLLKMPVIWDPTHIHPILKNPWWLYFPYTKDFSITLTAHGWRAGNSTFIIVFFFQFRYLYSNYFHVCSKSINRLYNDTLHISLNI